MQFTTIAEFHKPHGKNDNTAEPPHPLFADCHLRFCRIWKVLRQVVNDFEDSKNDIRKSNTFDNTNPTINPQNPNTQSRQFDPHSGPAPKSSDNYKHRRNLFSNAPTSDGQRSTSSKKHNLTRPLSTETLIDSQLNFLDHSTIHCETKLDYRLPLSLYINDWQRSNLSGSTLSTPTPDCPKTQLALLQSQRKIRRTIKPMDFSHIGMLAQNGSSPAHMEALNTYITSRIRDSYEELDDTFDPIDC